MSEIKFLAGDLLRSVTLRVVSGRKFRLGILSKYFFDNNCRESGEKNTREKRKYLPNDVNSVKSNLFFMVLADIFTEHFY